MIDEEATFEAFKYYATDLKPQSNKLIIATCDGCGKTRMLKRQNYRTLCQSCAHKGEIFTKEHKAKLSAAKRDEKHPMYNKHHTEEAKALISAAQTGRNNNNFGKRGEESFNYKGGKNIAWNRATAKRKRQLGYTLLAPLKEGEEGHHVTNEHVIGIPKEVHNSIGGSRKDHRTKVLQWLKANDKKKYIKVLCILAKEPLK